MPVPIYRTEAKHDDINAVRTITAETDFFRPDEVDVAVELIEERLVKGDASGYHYWLAELEGKVIGYICFGPTPCTIGSFDLYWIVVCKENQGLGIGAELMRRAEQTSAKMGCKRMYVETSGKEQYYPTRKFYEKNGYFQAAELPDFYTVGDSKIILQKNIP